MGINDWSYLNDGLDVSAVGRGATAERRPRLVVELEV